METHFSCFNLSSTDLLGFRGVPLEDDGSLGSRGSHWDLRWLKSEFMNAIIYDSLSYISYFTFALFQDSGWYIVDYNFAEPYYWGKNETCDFFNTPCIDSTTHTSNWPQYWCDSIYNDHCSFEYGGISYCQYFTGLNINNPQFQYFDDITAGGSKFSEYCPFQDAIRTTNQDLDFTDICWDIKGNNRSYQNGYSPLFPVVYGINSRCVKTVSNDLVFGGTNQPFQRGLCFQHECVGFDDNLNRWNGVLIQIGSGLTVECGRNDFDHVRIVEQTEDIDYSFNLTCPDIDAICGETEHPFDCVWGYWNDEMNQCVCSVGYTGTQCDIELQNIRESAQLCMLDTV